MNAGQYTRGKTQRLYISMQFQPLPNAAATSLPHNFSCSFWSYLFILLIMVTPDIVQQNLLAAPLSASINTQPLVCKSNAEQKISFTCVVTITTVSKHMQLKIVLSE